MSNTPEHSSRKDDRGKRRKLFFGEKGTAAESHSSHEERAGRWERASTSKSVDALEMKNSVVEEENCFYQNAAQASPTQCPKAGDVTPKHSLRIKTPIQDEQTKLEKLKSICIPKLEDADDAGTSNSIDCTLILTKGDSAKSQAVAGRSVAGRESFGVFTLERKVLNVQDVSRKEMVHNADIQNLIKILGLQYEKSYKTVEDLKSLRYGRLMIMTDPNADGSHFTGLIINFLHHNWPTLLRLHFLELFVIPVVIVKLKATKEAALNFYSLQKFEEWKTTANLTTYSIEHYKGLGSLTVEKMMAHFKELPRYRFVFYHDGDQDTDNAISQAFSPKHIGERKYWLNSYNDACKLLRSQGLTEDLYGKETKQISYYDFIKKDMVRYFKMEYERSTPSLIDGLKLEQRKVLFTVLNRNDKDVNVARLALSVAEHTAYYEPGSLMRTIMWMAQDFVGSNNISLLIPNGQFGTRHEGGKDAASPPLISTIISKLTRLIFHHQDGPLLTHRMDGDQRIEPEFYAPIIPLILVNGTSRIGMSYNPRDITENLKRMLDDEEPIPMDPWFKGYRGTVKRIDQHNFVSSGELSVLSPTTLEITELPIGVSAKIYKDSVLETLLCGSEGVSALITDFKEFHKHNTVRFVITMTEQKMQQAEAEGFHKAFQLQTIHSQKPTLLYDSNGSLRMYGSANEVLKAFFEVRLGLYRKRKEYLTDLIQAESKCLTNQSKFIREVCDNVYNFNLKELRQRGYDPNPVLIWKRKVGLNAEVAKMGEFDYLLGLLKPPYSDLRGSKEELIENREKRLKRFDVILKKSPAEFWRDDLAAFSVAFKKIEDDEQKELASIAESRREEKKSRDSDSDDAPKPSAKKANLRFI